MKPLEKFNAAMFAVLLCANFSACNDDDNESNGNVIDNKKITMLVYEYNQYGRTDTETTTFDYNPEGKLSLATYTDNHSTTSEYTWHTDAIDFTTGRGNFESYLLTNNLVQKSDHPYGCTFTYNKSKQMSTWKEPGPSAETTWTNSITWDGEKITTITHALGNKIRSKTTFTYNTRSCSGYNPLIVDVVYSETLAYAHPALFGLRSPQLPTSITTKDYDENTTETHNYEYEFDAEGYITKITGRTESEIVETWNITWE